MKGSLASTTSRAELEASKLVCCRYAGKIIRRLPSGRPCAWISASQDRTFDKDAFQSRISRQSSRGSGCGIVKRRRKGGEITSFGSEGDCYHLEEPLEKVALLRSFQNTHDLVGDHSISPIRWQACGVWRVCRGAACLSRWPGCRVGRSVPFAIGNR